MRGIYLDEGIVIKRKDWGEADRLLTLFTKKRGKILGIAKGVRKIYSRKASHLELFNCVRVQLVTTKSGLALIKEANILATFGFFRQSFERLIFAYKIAEEIDKLLPENEENQTIYSLLYWAFSKLNKKETNNPQKLILNFSHRLLWALGFLPFGEWLEESRLNFFLEDLMEERFRSNVFLTRWGEGYKIKNKAMNLRA